MAQPDEQGQPFRDRGPFIAAESAAASDVYSRGNVSLDSERAQEALRDSEARTRAIVTTAVDGIITIDEHGVVETMNPAAERLFGYASPEVVGQNVSLLMPEPYRHEHNGYLNRYLTTGEKRIIGIGREVVGLRKDGSTFPMELAVSEMGLANRRMFTGIVRDITERKQLEGQIRERLEELAHAEERMRSVVDNVVDGIITIDDKGTIATFNRAAESIFGFSASDVIGQNVRMLMPQPYKSQHDSYLTSYLSTGQAKIIGIGRQVVGLRKDGSTFPMELAVGEFRIGAQRFFTGIVRDVTERVRSQAEIEQLNAQLRRAMTETHHRVKNNLQIIAAMLDMQAMENLATVDTGEVQRVASHVRTLAQVHDLLTEQSKVDAAAEGAPARGLLERLLSLVRMGTQGRPIHLDAPRDIWLTTRQATSLALIANELVSNALKYGQGEIQVSLLLDKGILSLRVEDAGAGFSETFDANTESNTGLELVNMLARWDLQGSVTYDNRPEGGARVVVSMPATASMSFTESASSHD